MNKYSNCNKGSAFRRGLLLGLLMSDGKAYTRRELAQKIGVSKDTIARYLLELETIRPLEISRAPGGWRGGTPSQYRML